MSRRVRAILPVLAPVLISLVVAACGSGSGDSAQTTSSASGSHSLRLPIAAGAISQYTVPPLPDPGNVYGATMAGDLSPVVAHDRPLVYVPNAGSNTVDEIDPTTFRIVRHFAVGTLPQHVVPAYDLRTLWVTNDEGNSLTAINPATGVPERTVPVTDPYNLYFTPDGRYAIVMAEALRRMDFRDPHTMQLHHSLAVPECAGVNHADFTADGRYMFVSCEFGSAMIVVNIPTERVVKTIALPSGASPQDVILSPDGRVFYVADLTYGGLWVFDALSFNRIGFIRTGAGAHGLYPSRDATLLYVSNRTAGTISVVNFTTRRVVATWTIPGSSPDMGGVSADGRVLWLSGRYAGAVYAINTQTGKLIQAVPVGFQPHGVCVWPQPGRYSLGHTQLFR